LLGTGLDGHDTVHDKENGQTDKNDDCPVRRGIQSDSNYITGKINYELVNYVVDTGGP